MSIEHVVSEGCTTDVLGSLESWVSPTIKYADLPAGVYNIGMSCAGTSPMTVHFFPVKIKDGVETTLNPWKWDYIPGREFYMYIPTLGDGFKVGLENWEAAQLVTLFSTMAVCPDAE